MNARARRLAVLLTGALFAPAIVLASLPAADVNPAAAAAPTGAWISSTPTGFKRQEVTYVTVGSRLYLAGGKSTRQQVFDPATHTWTDVAPLPAALDHIPAVELSGLIYYVGGLDGYPGNSFGAVYTYNPATNVFGSVASLPAGRDRGAGGIATYQGKIYVAGGYHTGGTVAWFDVYNPSNNTWTTLPDMPERRDHTSAAVVSGKLYVIGGRTRGIGLRPENDVYDFASNTWTTGLAPLPTMRAGTATAVFGSEVVVIGGEGQGVGTFNNVEAYDTTSNSWRALAPMPTARHGIQAAMFAGSAYIAGGGTKMGGGGATDIHEVFALDGTPPGPALPDCRVKLMGDSSLIGNNVYGTTGANQTRSTTAAASMTRTFVFSMQNDSSVGNAITVQGPAAMPGFTVRYLAGLSGTTDITSRVVAGTYTTSVVPPGGVRSLRLLITASLGTATGTSGTWLVKAASGAAPAVVDACAAMLTVG